jgi:hypothetical protein
MLRLVVGLILVFTLAGCAAHAPTSTTGWRAWTIDPRTSQVVQDESLAPSYEACQAGIRDTITQATALGRDSSNPKCPGGLNALRAAQCAPVAIAAPAGPSGTDRFLQVLAILAAARGGRSSAGMVMGPIQWNAYGPGVHMDGTGRAVQLVPR